MFLALKKVGLRQYEDSDSKPGVGVSTFPAKGRQRQSRGSGGMTNREFFVSEKALGVF